MTEPTKTPNKDVIIFDSDYISEDSIADILLEDIGGIELITLSNRETIDGLNPYYTLISNLSRIRREFDPSQIIAKQRSKQSYFDKFAIDLDSKIPDEEYLEDNGLSNWFYRDADGNFVIELDNIGPDENIEVEIAQVL